MSAAPCSQEEPPAQRGAPTLVAYVGIAVGFLGLSVLLCAAGVVDERIAPLWNPAIVAAAAMGLVYAEPRPPLWQAVCAGAVLGLAYGGMVLVADALGAVHVHLDRADVLLRALAIGAGPALVGALLLRWFAPRTPGRRAR